VSKSESSQRLIAAQTPDWLLETAQQIQVIDYELHAAIRIISKGQMRPENIPAFLDACTKRDRLMAQLLGHLAEQHKEARQKASVAAHNSTP
jgi:hypothetical protein